MKEYKPQILNKKPRPSRFYESFIESKGPQGVTRATNAEIQKNLKSFYLDLAYGNIVQDKYMTFIMEEPRVFQEAVNDVSNRIMEYTIILRSMDCAISNNLPIIAQPMFNVTYNKYMMKANTYNTILTGLQNFMMSLDIGYLVSISAQLNSGIIRGSKQQLML